MPGDVVYEVTPEDDGSLTVRTENGEEGEIPSSCIREGNDKPVMILSFIMIYKCFFRIRVEGIENCRETKIERNKNLFGAR